MQVWTSMVAVLLSCTVMASSSRAHEVRMAEQAAPAEASAAVPLYDDLGNLTYPVTTPSPLAQRYFDQGLRLTYAFNHAEALRAFREAQRHCRESSRSSNDQGKDASIACQRAGTDAHQRPHHTLYGCPKDGAGRHGLGLRRGDGRSHTALS